MRRCSRSQTDQGEVLNDYYHVTFALVTPCSKGHVITIASFFLQTSSAKRESRWREEWKPGEKPPNPMRKTREENRGTTKNILAP